MLMLLLLLLMAGWLVFVLLRFMNTHDFRTCTNSDAKFLF